MYADWIISRTGHVYSFTGGHWFGGGDDWLTVDKMWRRSAMILSNAKCRRAQFVLGLYRFVNGAPPAATREKRRWRVHDMGRRRAALCLQQNKFTCLHAPTVMYSRCLFSIYFIITKRLKLELCTIKKQQPLGNMAIWRLTPRNTRTIRGSLVVHLNRTKEGICDLILFNNNADDLIKCICIDI